MTENKVLILEDDIVVAMDLQELLNDSGYVTMIAHSYEEAFRITKTFKPNLAIYALAIPSRAYKIILRSAS